MLLASHGVARAGQADMSPQQRWRTVFPRQQRPAFFTLPRQQRPYAVSSLTHAAGCQVDPTLQFGYAVTCINSSAAQFRAYPNEQCSGDPIFSGDEQTFPTACSTMTEDGTAFWGIQTCVTGAYVPPVQPAGSSYLSAQQYFASGAQSCSPSQPTLTTFGVSPGDTCLTDGTSSAM